MKVFAKGSKIYKYSAAVVAVTNNESYFLTANNLTVEMKYLFTAAFLLLLASTQAQTPKQLLRKISDLEGTWIYQGKTMQAEQTWSSNGKAMAAVCIHTSNGKSVEY